MNRIYFETASFLKLILRVFYSFINGGEECVVCKKRTFMLPVCKCCENEFFSLKNSLEIKRCRICGKELVSTDELCLQCRESPVLKHTDFVLPLFSYRLWNKELMFKWKSQGIRTLSFYFARILSGVLREVGVDVIVPVPPRPGKLEKNGWDQIDELCTILKYHHGFKILPVLERHSVEEQKKLDRQNRLDSIGKSYFLRQEAEIRRLLKPFHGTFPSSVCVLDDVCTTGATLESCAYLLKKVGIKKVMGVTLFIVD